MTTPVVHKRNIAEKQMGCMAGFFHMFDRHHISTGKKRLPPPVVAPNSPPESERTNQTDAPPSEKEIQAAPVELPSKRLLPFASFEFKERGANSYTWKLSKEIPRLSLDSRATFDAKLGSLQPLEIQTRGTIHSSRRSDCSEDRSETDAEDKQLRSPSVVARLMGLDLLPQSNASPAKNELRRSASESRIAYRLTDADNFKDQSKFAMKNSQSNVKRINAITARTEVTSSRSDSQNNKLMASPWKAAQQQPKSFFNSADFFPEPKRCVSAYNEMEKRLRMRGMDEQFKDLEALKRILEALQFKGLLHSSKISDQRNKRSFVLTDDHPIVLMKPSRLLINRVGNNSSANLRRSREDPRQGTEIASAFTSVSPRRQRQQLEVEQGRQCQTKVKNSPGRKESKERVPNSSVGRRSPSQRKANEVKEQKRSVSPAHSPRPNARTKGSNQLAAIDTPRNKKQMAKIPVSCPGDESSSISESSVSNFSQTDTERSKWEEHKEGKTLTERCNKLLHSIIEMNVAESQPSPISVLDYKDDSASPSPVMKRNIDFKESDEETWSTAAISPTDESDDCDFLFFSQILRASSYLQQEAELFFYQKLGESGRSNRKLIMDAVSEIASRKEQLPPWKEDCWSTLTEEKKAWLEFQSMREREATGENDVFEMVCAALRKDLAGDGMIGWKDWHVETAEAVLDMERLIFRDLIGESIREVAVSGGKIGSFSAASRRRLVFSN